MPQIERAGNRIVLRAGEGYVPRQEFDRCEMKAKRIIGSSWRKRDRVWSYPLDIVICRDLRAEFGDSLEIGPELWKWARDQVRIEQRLRPLLTARDSNSLKLLPKRAPLIWEAMNTVKCVEPGCPGVNSKTHRSEDGGTTHRVMDYRYQKAVVEYCTVARKWQNGSSPGLGKTIETLGTLVESDVRGLVLVAAPKTSLRTVWEPEVQRWLPGTPVFACTGGKRRRQSTLDAAMRAWQSGKHTMVIVVINPEMLRTHSIEECKVAGCGYHCEDHRDKGLDEKFPLHDESHVTMKWYEHEYPALFETPWAAFIVDETHRYLLRVNMRTNKVTLVGVGAMLLPLEDGAIKGALSGTPWKGRPKNAWSTRHWLDGDVGLAASFWNWAERMLQVEHEEGRHGERTHRRIGGINDEDTFNHWVDGFMIRHTKAEMTPWLPPKVYVGAPLDPRDKNSPHGIWLELEGPQLSVYKAMEDDAAVKLDNGTLIGNGVLAEMTRLKQFAIAHGSLRDKRVKSRTKPGEYDIVKHLVPKLPSNKFDWSLEFLEEHGITGKSADDEGDNKVVFASQFTAVLNLFAAEYRQRGIECFLLTGEQSDLEREQAVKRWQQPGGPRLFLINTTAGGVSVTLDAADDLTFIDETYVPDDQEQVEDRIHRVSRIHNVMVRYLRSRGTIEERIARMNTDKDDLQKRLLDGKRGVEFAKQLLGMAA